MSSIKVHRIHEIAQLFAILHRLARERAGPSEREDLESGANDSADHHRRRLVVVVDSLSVLCALTPSSELNPILANFASVCRCFVNRPSAPGMIVVVNGVRSSRGEGMANQLSGGLDEEAAAPRRHEEKVTPDLVDGAFLTTLRPALGNYWLCVPNVRLLVTNLGNKRRAISVWNSCQLKDGDSCLVDIRDEGIIQRS